MPAAIIANCFLVDGGNNMRAIPSSPGRTVDFRANLAVIRDERDLVACLRHEGVQVDVVPEYVEWIAGVMNQCGTAQPPKAAVHMPPGYYIKGEPGEYEVRMEMPVSAALMEPAERMSNGHKIDCACPWCNKIRRESNWAPS